MIKITEDKNMTELPSQKKKNTVKEADTKKKTERVNLMPEEPRQEYKAHTKVVKTFLNGRKGPSFSEKVIEVYNPGTKLVITEEIGEWGKTANGTYVKLEFVE